ncbi:unnamed protein product [Linum tenue]|uniref:DYW domain-containing protein n=1 Tax=Linum tenue TaxID=586396 RepID=A0AAV0S6D2_9ROSI|nr:unnamed protein product [Linum tenue]
MKVDKLKLRQAVDSLYSIGPATQESYTRLVIECFRANDADQAKRLQSHMDAYSYRPADSFIHNRLLHLYAKSGQIPSARQLFDKMPHRDIFSWNAMLSLYAKSGCVDDLQGTFDRMPSRDSVSYNTVISGLAGRGCASKALSKRNIKYGEMAARKLFALDPLNAGPYILLSNMYASDGRWKDVAALRSLMKTNNVKKFAAYSWVDINNEVHKFVANDRIHVDSIAIYKELDDLIKKVQEVGYKPSTNLVLHDVGEQEKLESISYHSEKLALAFMLMKRPHESMPVRILKNLRVCGDCHAFMKFSSKVTGRTIVLRDSNRFHHFVGGKCSCNDHW